MQHKLNLAIPVDMDESKVMNNSQPTSLPHVALSGLQDFTEGTEPVGFIPGKDRQYILTGTSFGEKGCIHQVKVLAEAHGGVFAIDVWRPVSDSKSSFTLASSMEFTPRVQTRTIFLLDASPAVQFQADDLIGFHLVDNIADFQVGWTSAPSQGLKMSAISTQGGDSPITTFPGSSWVVLKTTWPIVFLSTSDSGICYIIMHSVLPFSILYLVVSY